MILLVRLLLVGLLAGLASAETLIPHVYAWTYSLRPAPTDMGRGPHSPRRSAATPREVAQTERPTASGDTTTLPPLPAVPPSRYDQVIAHHATRSAVSIDLVRALIQVESDFDPRARSSKGAMGLMQLMPETAAELGVTNPYDPSENIRGGVTYLKQLLTRYHGDEVLALAAYNAGPGAVSRYGHRVPPYPETRSYVARIRSLAWAESKADGPTRYKTYAIEGGRWKTVYTWVPSAVAQYETVPGL